MAPEGPVLRANVHVKTGQAFCDMNNAHLAKLLDLTTACYLLYKILRFCHICASVD